MSYVKNYPRARGDSSESKPSATVTGNECLRIVRRRFSRFQAFVAFAFEAEGVRTIPQHLAVDLFNLVVLCDRGLSERAAWAIVDPCKHVRGSQNLVQRSAPLGFDLKAALEGG